MNAILVLSFTIIGALPCAAQQAAMGTVSPHVAMKKRPAEKRNNTTDVYKPWSGKDYAGQLTKPLGSYSAQQLIDQLHGIDWFGWNRDRACLKHATCAAAGDSASLTIQAIVDAQRVKVNAPAGGYGVVIGRMSNNGEYQDSTTQIPGGQAFPDVYYFVVQPTGTPTAGLRVAVVSYDQRTGTPFTSLTIRTATRGIYACPKHKAGRKYPQGDFASCDMTSPNDTLKGPGLGLRAQGVLPAGANLSDATPWFSCSDGCCSAQIPPYSLVREVARRHARALHLQAGSGRPIHKE